MRQVFEFLIQGALQRIKVSVFPGLRYFAKRNETKRNGTLRNGTLRNGTLGNEKMKTRKISGNKTEWTGFLAKSALLFLRFKS